MGSSIGKVVMKIWGLAEKRNWVIPSRAKSNNFCLHDYYVIYVGRNGIKKYVDEYLKCCGKSLSSNNIEITNKEIYKKLDKQLVEIIRKEIPEANGYDFYFYSVVDVKGFPAKHKHIIKGKNK